jgi:hypothetical protein
MELLMKTKGIRISDGKGNILAPRLSNILEEITDGDPFFWSIIFLDGTPTPGQGHFLCEYQKKINNSENGIPIKLEELFMLSNQFFQMFEITILGCSDAKLLRRYETEKEMYITCDIVIDLIDCAFWEVYAKDLKLLNKLQKKFREIELLEG